jgi:PhnB protein
MNGTTTYLHFDGNCRTAMAFYRACLGGELEVMAYPDASGQPDADPEARVMHSRLASGGKTLLMASDHPTGTGRSTGDSRCSVFVDCGADEEVDTLFAALSRDGQVTVAPADMPSGRFGMCTDPFGVAWILHCAASCTRGGNADNMPIPPVAAACGPSTP